MDFKPKSVFFKDSNGEIGIEAAVSFKNFCGAVLFRFGGGQKPAQDGFDSLFRSVMVGALNRFCRKRNYNFSVSESETRSEVAFVGKFEFEDISEFGKNAESALVRYFENNPEITEMVLDRIF